jgi:hypothetical protein
MSSSSSLPRAEAGASSGPETDLGARLLALHQDSKKSPDEAMASAFTEVAMSMDDAGRKAHGQRAVGAALAVLRCRSGVCDVVAACLRTLTAALSGPGPSTVCSPNAEALVEADGGVVLVKGAMEEHLYHEQVVLWGCRLVQALARHDRGKSLLLHLDFHGLLVNLVLAPAKNVGAAWGMSVSWAGSAGIQEAAWGAVALFATGSAPVGRALWTNRPLFAAGKTALITHAQVPGVVSCVLRLLAVLFQHPFYKVAKDLGTLVHAAGVAWQMLPTTAATIGGHRYFAFFTAAIVAQVPVLRDMVPLAAISSAMASWLACPGMDGAWFKQCVLLLDAALAQDVSIPDRWRLAGTTLAHLVKYAKGPEDASDADKAMAAAVKLLQGEGIGHRHMFADVAETASPNTIIAALDLYPKHAPLQKQGAKLVGILSDPSMSWGNSDVPRRLLASMYDCNEFAGVQVQACRALAAACVGGGQSTATRLASKFGLAPVFDALTDHAPFDRHVARWACELLGALASSGSPLAASELLRLDAVGHVRGLLFPTGKSAHAEDGAAGPAPQGKPLNALQVAGAIKALKGLVDIAPASVADAALLEAIVSLVDRLAERDAQAAKDAVLAAFGLFGAVAKVSQVAKGVLIGAGAARLVWDMVRTKPLPGPGQRGLDKVRGAALGCLQNLAFRTPAVHALLSKPDAVTDLLQILDSIMDSPATFHVQSALYCLAGAIQGGGDIPHDLQSSVKEAAYRAAVRHRGHPGIQKASASVVKACK